MADRMAPNCLRADCPADVSLGAVAGRTACKCNGCLVCVDIGLRLLLTLYYLSFVGGETPGFLAPNIYTASLRCEFRDPLDLSF
jgi:hypothetical protein